VASGRLGTLVSAGRLAEFYARADPQVAQPVDGGRS
jgi:hypothetical protein